MLWRAGHLLGIEALRPEEIRTCLDQACELLAAPAQSTDMSPHKGKKIGIYSGDMTSPDLSSMIAAAEQLGLERIQVDASPNTPISALAEAIAHTEADILAIAHAQTGTPAQLARKLNCPVINLGDGHHEDPLGACAIAVLLERNKARLHRLNIAICGDIAQDPLLHSAILLLGKMENRIRLIAPSALLPEDATAMGVEVFINCETGLTSVDAIISAPPNRTRLTGSPIPSERDYAHRFALTPERLALAKPDVLQLELLPQEVRKRAATPFGASTDANTRDAHEIAIALRAAVIDLLLTQSDTTRSSVWP